MENARNILIVVDAGHGGYDNGASYNGRLEKDDNLRLSLAVQRELLAQGVNVLMTRDTDVFIPLAERARMANEAGADLFMAIHRNSYTQQTPSTNGVENFIYLTAPDATVGRAATLVLDEVVNAGVQSNRGVKRGNYYVLRRTNMPAMLLEMGYIINDEDNRLFDEKLNQYAAAIAKGALAYFGIPYQSGSGAVVTAPTAPVSPSVPSTPSVPPASSGSPVAQAQEVLNRTYGENLQVDGNYGPATKKVVVGALQQELNTHYNAGLRVDGIYGPLTRAAVPNIRDGVAGNLPLLVQVLLLLRGYNPGTPDNRYGAQTAQTVQMFQRDNYLVPDGIAGPLTVSALME